MTEQERPRTEAEPIARLRRMMERVSGSDRWGPYIDAAVEAARTEGRQQAVREAMDLANDVRLAALANSQPWILGTDAWKRLADWLRMAGLNASESPDPEYDRQLVELAGRRAAERHASESGQPHKYRGERNRSDDRCLDCGKEYANLIHESGQPRPHIESCESETRVWFNDHGRCQCWCHDAEHENRRMLEAMRASESGQLPEASDD